MNKKVIGIGMFLVIIILLFPPVEYVDSKTRAFSNALGGHSSESSYTEVTIRPIWNIDGEYPMTDERIHTQYWLIEIVITVIFIIGISYLVGRPENERN